MSYRTVMQISVVILIFAYIALGPYSSIYQQAIDQVKGPAEIAYRSVKNAIYDIYLLATNPTEWYARQQVVNSKYEKPISFPKGLEVNTLDVTPSSVPGGQPFVMNFVVKNEGDLEATNPQVFVSCNQWCIAPPPLNETPEKFYLCYNDNTLIANEFFCSGNCSNEEHYVKNADNTQKMEYSTAEACVTECKNNEDLLATKIFKGPLRGTVDICTTTDPQALVQSVYFLPSSYLKGASDIVTIQPFISKALSRREAETHIAKVYLNMSYYYSTSSQLLVTVMGSTEKQRLIRENLLEFKPVVATCKVSPAKLSLNVGPQPLEADGKEKTLLVAVSNDREDSHILLERGTKMIIRLPIEIGSGLTCGGSSKTERRYVYSYGNGSESIYYNDNGIMYDNDFVGPTDSSRIIAEELIYTVEPESGSEAVDIRPYDFNSIFVFLCKFTPKEPSETVKTGIITAQLPAYKFVHTVTKNVPITTPIGILYNPYEGECNKCGEGVLNGCDKNECYSHSTENRGDVTGLCYLETAAINECHACGLNPTCEMFTSASCGSESSRCGLECIFVPGLQNSVGSNTGLCKNGTMPSGILPTELKVTGPCALTYDPNGVTEQQIIDYIETKTPAASLLRGKGSYIYQESKNTGVNPAFILAIAMIESTSGTSPLANCKRNLFGWGAKDTCKDDQCRDREDCAQNFESVEQCISTVTKGIYERWLSPNPKWPPQRTTLDMMSGKTPIAEGWAVYATSTTWPSSVAQKMSEITGEKCSPTSVTIERPTSWASSDIFPNSDTMFTSPNFNDRPSWAVINTIVLHCSAGDFTSTINTLINPSTTANPAGRVSAHYVVDTDGTVYSLVAENKRAWHAKIANDYSIGIEIINADKAKCAKEYTDAQYTSLTNLINYLTNKYPAIIPAKIIGHSDVPNSDKNDPWVPPFKWNRIPSNYHYTQPTV